MRNDGGYVSYFPLFIFRFFFSIYKHFSLYEHENLMAVVVHGLKGVIIFCTTQNNPLVVNSQRGSVDETVRKVWLRQ